VTLAVLDELGKAVHEQKAVGQTSQGIGDFALSNIGLRSKPSGAACRRIANHDSSAQHPPEHTILMAHAGFAFEMRRRSVEMSGNAAFYLL
jgi:hypothetical protein